MAFGPGDLSDQLMIQVSTMTQGDAHGSPKLDWKDSNWIWCKVQFLTVSEQLKSTGQVGVNVCRVKTDWLGGKWITSKMRGRWINGNNMILEFTGIRPAPATDELIIEGVAIS